MEKTKAKILVIDDDPDFIDAVILILRSASYDVITAVNQQRVNNVAELEQALKALPSGSRVPVTYYRGEEAIKSEITL